MDPFLIFEELITKAKKQKQQLSEKKGILKVKRNQFIAIDNEVNRELKEMENLREKLEKLMEETQASLKLYDEICTKNYTIGKKIVNTQVKPSKTDTDRLLNFRMKFEQYKSFTGVRWKFDTINECLKGAITNKKDYVYAFHYPLDAKNISQQLWDEIEKSVEHHEHDMINELQNQQIC